MSRVKHLATHIERTVTGPMWHGPALNDVLAGVTPERAAAGPIASAHSIWEIVLHVIAWVDIANARLKGDRIGDPSTAEDWPPVDKTGAAEWQRAIDELGAAHRRLAADTRELDEARLSEKIPGLEYSVDVLLHGVVEHGTYHGGQIALLKKA